MCAIFRLLFSRLGLLLLAIELKDEDKKECNIAINPGKFDSREFERRAG